mmetsp:Transcript_26679/g.48435  ORF Transcript_26679/g.48435 Transcript_26679/m.48435 type:complete len:255 (-) Transcript_26679:629-1393(-)
MKDKVEILQLFQSFRCHGSRRLDRRRRRVVVVGVIIILVLVIGESSVISRVFRALGLDPSSQGSIILWHIQMSVPVSEFHQLSHIGIPRMLLLVPNKTHLIQEDYFFRRQWIRPISSLLSFQTRRTRTTTTRRIRRRRRRSCCWILGWMVAFAQEIVMDTLGLDPCSQLWMLCGNIGTSVNGNIDVELFVSFHPGISLAFGHFRRVSRIRIIRIIIVIRGGRRLALRLTLTCLESFPAGQGGSRSLMFLRRQRQ